jgi:predicted dehydrogenase
MNYLLDEVPRRVAVVHASPLNSGRSDVAFIGLYYPSGIIGQIHVSWVDSNKIRKFQVIGSKARVVFDDLNNLEPVRFFETGIGVSRSVAQDFGDFRYLLSDGDIISPKIAMEEPLQAAVSSFLRLVHDGEETIADLSFTRDVVRTLAAASRSVAADGAPQEV